VCVAEAPSGEDGIGYTLVAPKEWLKQCMKWMQIVLKALEIAGKLAGLPVPNLSAVLPSVDDLIPALS
jgi:hypothetical protein